MPVPRARAVRRLTHLTLALVVAGSLAACSDDGGGDGASKSTTSTTRARLTTTSGPPPATAPPTTPSTEPGAPSTTSSLPSLPDTEEGYTEALTGSYDASADTGGFTEDDVACMAKRIVAAIGVEKFEEADVSADQVRSGSFNLDELGLSEAQAKGVVRAYAQCDVDIVELYRSGLPLDDATPAQLKCIDEILTQKTIEKVLIDQMRGADTADNPLEKLNECMS